MLHLEAKLKVALTCNILFLSCLLISYQSIRDEFLIAVIINRSIQPLKKQG